MNDRPTSSNKLSSWAELAFEQGAFLGASAHLRCLVMATTLPLTSPLHAVPVVIKTLPCAPFR